MLIHGTEVIISDDPLVEVYCKWLWEGLRVVVNMNVLSNLLSISLTLQKFTVSIEVIYNFNLLTAVQ